MHWALAACTAVLFLAAGCTAPPVRNPGAADAVLARDHRFDPRELEVPTGTAVVWRNVGGAHHTVSIRMADAAPDAWLMDQPDPALAPGDEASFVFSEGGTFHVYCRYHSQAGSTAFNPSEMVMKVTVVGQEA
jgi:plastocyanin